MDEPTIPLAGGDAQRLFGIIRRLKSQGVGIIYISHFLEEVQQIADRSTVLRDGKKAGTGRTDEISLESIIKMMVGGEVKELFPQVAHQAGEDSLESGALKGNYRRD